MKLSSTELTLEEFLITLSRRSSVRPVFDLAAQSEAEISVTLENWWESPLRLKTFVYRRLDVFRFVFTTSKILFCGAPLFFVYSAPNNSRYSLLTQFRDSVADDGLCYTVPVDVHVANVGDAQLQTFAIVGIPVPIRRLFRSGNLHRDVSPELFASWWKNLIAPPPNPSRLLRWLEAQLPKAALRAFQEFEVGNSSALEQLPARYSSAKPLFSVWTELRALMRG